MSAKQILASIRTCHRIAREGVGYVGAAHLYNLDLTELQLELVELRRRRVPIMANILFAA